VLGLIAIALATALALRTTKSASRVPRDCRIHVHSYPLLPALHFELIIFGIRSPGKDAPLSLIIRSATYHPSLHIWEGSRHSSGCTNAILVSSLLNSGYLDRGQGVQRSTHLLNVSTLGRLPDLRIRSPNEAVPRIVQLVYASLVSYPRLVRRTRRPIYISLVYCLVRSNDVTFAGYVDIFAPRTSTRQGNL
jgi:hypothetical protein